MLPVMHYLCKNRHDHSGNEARDKSGYRAGYYERREISPQQTSGDHGCGGELTDVVQDSGGYRDPCPGHAAIRAFVNKAPENA